MGNFCEKCGDFIFKHCNCKPYYVCLDEELDPSFIDDNDLSCFSIIYKRWSDDAARKFIEQCYHTDISDYINTEINVTVCEIIDGKIEVENFIVEPTVEVVYNAYINEK